MSWNDLLKKLLSSVKGKENIKESIEKPHVETSKKIRKKPVTKKIPGHHTQLNNVDINSPKQQLIIGLDFGTAYTKTVIGEARISYAVPFSPYTSGDNLYLMPGQFYIDKNNICSLSQDSPDKILIENIKMRLLEGDYSIDAQVNATIYIALIFKHTREWLLNNHKNTYKGKYIDWNVNVGLPTDNYQDGKLAAIYNNIANAAWYISILPDAINKRGAITIIQEINQKKLQTKLKKEPGMIASEYINLFPEFAAQVTGYVRSPMRREDMHAMLDIGAGTTDFTVFIVWENSGEDKFPIMAKSVKSLGVRYLIKHRINKSNYKGNNLFERNNKLLDDKAFSKQLGLESKELSNIDSQFRAMVRTQVIEQFAYTKDCRYTLPQRWKEEIPFFLCGGGANVNLYKDIVKSIERKNKPYKIKTLNLPKPDKLQADGLSESQYNRLSVAYGLSFDAFDIGVITYPPNEPPVTIDKCDGYMCTLCSGTGEPMGNCPQCGGSGWSKVEQAGYKYVKFTYE